MYGSRIPSFIQFFLPDIICRIPNRSVKGEVHDKRIVYLTFDDGPIPETTPYILETLKQHGIKATFFCVGENVKKHPELFKQILEEGHSVGNHTFNHLKGWVTSFEKYIDNIKQCAEYIDSDLFRPPYGKMTYGQYKVLRNEYKLIFWDVITPDFDTTISAEKCFEVVKKKTRSGSILVFHDNLKAKNKLTELLPGVLNFLLNDGYDIQPVVNNRGK